MFNILLTINIVVSITLVILILLQQGKGADAGASFGGGGSSQSVFGSAGSANFLSRTTAIFAVIFFALNLSLTYISNNSIKESGNSYNSVVTKETPEIPEGSQDGAIPVQGKENNLESKIKALNKGDSDDGKKSEDTNPASSIPEK